MDQDPKDLAAESVSFGADAVLSRLKVRLCELPIKNRGGFVVLVGPGQECHRDCGVVEGLVAFVGDLTIHGARDLGVCSSGPQEPPNQEK